MADFSYLYIDFSLSFVLSCKHHTYMYTYITAVWSENSQQKVNPYQEHKALFMICLVRVTVILITFFSNLTYWSIRKKKKKERNNILGVVLKELQIVCT